MTSLVGSHRLEGLEPDNLLAFLALLGLLRALEAADAESNAAPLRPRVAWDFDELPVRPVLLTEREAARAEVLERTVQGIRAISSVYDFGGRNNLDFSASESRALLCEAVEKASRTSRHRADLLSALMSDAIVKDAAGQPVQPTPLCLLFGQGHQCFLERLARVPSEAILPQTSKAKKKQGAVTSEIRCLEEALFEPWHRKDPMSSSFRWDPEEDVRYALMAGDPTDAAYKGGTQHGANRLAAIGLASLTLVPAVSGGRTRANILGGRTERQGFSFAWPLWRPPATFAAIRTLLAHPRLRTPGALSHLGVEHVLAARRISVGKFLNFARARPLDMESAQ